MNPEIIKSYLVSLGFSIDRKGNADFQKTIKDAGVQVARLAGTMAKDFVAAGVAVTGALMSISGATVAMIDNIAQADMGYQLFARRMFMSTEAAKKLKIATDALGYSLEDIIWGPPELRARYYQLIQDQRTMEGGLGGDFESQMRGIRDIRFEFTRLRVDLQYLAMGTVGAISRALFGDKDALLNKLRAVNEWLIHNLPYISNQLAHYIVPIMKDMWQIGKDIWEILKDVATVFLRIIGILSGDQALASGTANLQSFGMAALHVANALTYVYDTLKDVVDFLMAHPVLAGTLLGAVTGGVGGATLGVSGGFLAGGLPGAATGLLYGGLGGAILGAGTGAAGGYFYGKGVNAANKQQIQSMIAQTAMRMGVDPSLALSVANQESGFNPNALNAASGARGLFQLMPSTIAKFGLNPDDPQQNTQMGITLLHDLLNKHNGDTALALRDYGGFITKDPSSYVKAIQGGMSQWRISMPSNGGDTTIDVGGIHITQPNATPDQIQGAVTRALREGVSRQIMRNNVQFDGPY